MGDEVQGTMLWFTPEARAVLLAARSSALAATGSSASVLLRSLGVDVDTLEEVC